MEWERSVKRGRGVQREGEEGEDKPDSGKRYPARKEGLLQDKATIYLDQPDVFGHAHGRLVSYDRTRGGVEVTTEEGAVTTSRLLVQLVQSRHSGRYTCAPANSKPKSVNVHVLAGSEEMLKGEEERLESGEEMLEDDMLEGEEERLESGKEMLEGKERSLEGDQTAAIVHENNGGEEEQQEGEKSCDLVVARVKLQYSTQETKIDGGKIASTPGVTVQIKLSKTVAPEKTTDPQQRRDTNLQDEVGW
ncbi:hypothetical protein Pcinc_044237 [Petrolisthes cinctipes]|uniref:Uncharacterized protein n=1 Tax=Petrolisthes cinctipes TaxID=88211 RepID=A0AAE1BF78_PETCI|nr:hypothetical protein Pcinc_044237 [Petrolisthes cinctipes]